MSHPNSQPDAETSPHIEKLLDAANSASQSVAALHIAFMAFVAYLGVIVWGTTHEDLLRISPVKLPILDVELPLTAFYCVVPWMVVLLHFNLLMQLELLSCKLWNLDRDLPTTTSGQQIRDRLFIFPFTHLIVGRSSVWLIRWLLSLIVGITVIALPLIMLLAAQIRFLPFHDEAITWSQRLAVWIDAAMLLALWPLIASPQDRAREWWKNAAFQLLGYWPATLRHWLALGWNRLIRFLQRRWPAVPMRELDVHAVLHNGIQPKGMVVLLFSLPMVLLLSIVAVIPGSITVHAYFNPTVHNKVSEDSRTYFEDWLIQRAPQSWLSVAVHKNDLVFCTSLALAEKTEASSLQVMFGPCSWFNLGFFPRNLSLKESRLVPKEVSLSLLTKAIALDKSVRDAAFKEFDGLNLQNRDLRFANLLGAVLPKADLRHVQLQGAILLKAKLQGIIGWDKTQLQGAILGGTQLQGAGLIEADLQNADLRGANLHGADLSWAKLQSADLRGANLQVANLQGTKLQGADLRGANLQGANLKNAQLQGVDLSYAKLEGSELMQADLQGALLQETRVHGSDWSQTNLEGIYLVESAEADWNTHHQQKLETMLQPIMDPEKLSALQKRLQSADTRMSLNQSPRRKGCYSAKTALLLCDYHQPEQLAAYRTESLHPKLRELACSDASIATGIAIRSSETAQNSSPYFGLTTELLKVLDMPKPCPGLAALPEQILNKLRNTAEQQNHQ
ncbi:MAG: pentapeptide repeat-containing protein [Methylococcaceae bacterium]|nr:pentapeptide repeat-containing protein [Methylococcaceae bacterium]